MVLPQSFAGSASGKELLCQYRRLKRQRFDAWGRKIPWGRKWPSFLQYSFLENPMEGIPWEEPGICSPQGHTELGTAEVTACTVDL